MELLELVKTIVSSIVDEPEKAKIEQSETEKGLLIEVKVAKDDVGKIIGKKGRVASSLRTIAKASGAKQSKRVMINVYNVAVDEE
jgi:uncharacterized protein